MTLSTPREEMQTVQEILAADTGVRPSPPLLETSPVSFELKDISVDRYLTREWVDLEYRHLWSKVWQWACCEEDIPNVGDFHVYDIGHNQ